MAVRELAMKVLATKKKGLHLSNADKSDNDQLNEQNPDNPDPATPITSRVTVNERTTYISSESDMEIDGEENTKVFQ